MLILYHVSLYVSNSSLWMITTISLLLQQALWRTSSFYILEAWCAASVNILSAKASWHVWNSVVTFRCPWPVLARHLHVPLALFVSLSFSLSFSLSVFFLFFFSLSRLFFCVFLWLLPSVFLFASPCFSLSSFGSVSFCSFFFLSLYLSLGVSLSV